MISEKSKFFFTILSYIEGLLVSALVVNECVSISTFAPLVGIPIEIKSSEIGLNTCAITAVIKKYKTIIKKKKNKHDEIVLLAEKLNRETNLNTKNVLISRINSYISYDEFVSVNNMLKEYDDMKKEIKILNNRLISLIQ